MEACGRIIRKRCILNRKQRSPGEPYRPLQNMSLFDKIFAKKKPPAPPKADPPNPPATIKVWDSYGRIAELPREQWRKLLPDNFKKQWNSPNELADLIVSCLRDGFFEECLGPARQLCRIDPQPHRAANLLGVTLLQLRRFDEAEKVITEALRRHGEEGSLLTNLA
jgi:hypothetical protein